MKLMNEWLTQELTFQYSNEIEKQLHKDDMISKGFTIARQPVFMQKDNRVTYQKRKLVDNVVIF